MLATKQERLKHIVVIIRIIAAKFQLNVNPIQNNIYILKTRLLEH